MLCWPDRSFDRPWRISRRARSGCSCRKLKGLRRLARWWWRWNRRAPTATCCVRRLATGHRGAAGLGSKAVKDHAETFDGVPSQHDGKDAAVIAELCWMGKGAPWAWRAVPRRTRRCDIGFASWTRRSGSSRCICGKLESLLARHWPEVFGAAQAVGSDADAGVARWATRGAGGGRAGGALLKGFGGHYLTDEKIAAGDRRRPVDAGRADERLAGPGDAGRGPGDRAARAEIADAGVAEKKLTRIMRRSGRRRRR